MQRGQQSIYRNFVNGCSQRCSLNNVKCAIQHVRSELKLKKTCVCVYIYIYVNFGWEQNCIVCKYSKTIVPTGIRRHNQTMLSNIRRLWISSFLIMAGMVTWTWHTSNWALKDLYSFQISFSFYHSCFVLAPNSFNIRNTWHFPRRNHTTSSNK